MTDRPRIDPFGDAAVLVAGVDIATAPALAALVGRLARTGDLPGVEDVVLGFGAVTVLLDPDRAEPEPVAEALAVAWDAVEGGRSGPRAGDSRPVQAPLELRVRFDGPDLEEVASRAGTTPSGVVALLEESELEVAFLGFSPGFAYLHGLPPALAGLARRERPRPVVPAGSLALGGAFAAVYPQATPGGWHLVGRTDAVLFDVEHPPYAVLEPGRRVRVLATEDDLRLPAPPVRPSLSAVGAGLVVERGGPCSVVEDGGRLGVAALGVPRAGAADPVAAGLANRLLGNAEATAVIEVTAHGPRLRATADVHVCVVGDPAREGAATVHVEGHPAPDEAVIPVAAGQVLDIGSCAAVRAVLAVAGGLDTPMVLGSRSSDLLCGLGPAPLGPGDVVGVGRAERPRGRLGRLPGSSSSGEPVVLRVLQGPDSSSLTGSPVVDCDWVVTPDSNRVGIRLRRLGDDAEASPTTAGSSGSRGMVRGAVQLPSSAEVIVLGPDHATVGGYPVPAVVIRADLHRLAHLPTGARVRFEAVDAAEARAARQWLARAVEGAVAGWYPTRAG